VTVRRLAPAHGLTTARIRRAVQQALGGRPVAALNVAVVDDVQIARLHDEYMGDPSPTDVLTFDLRDNAGDQAVEGEIVVSADTARREARRRRLEPSEELTRYIIHGVLHLLGLQDATPQERRRMRREENRILGLLRGRVALGRVALAERVAPRAGKPEPRRPVQTARKNRSKAGPRRPAGQQRKSK
jgi:probable rRNA maturation factor